MEETEEIEVKEMYFNLELNSFLSISNSFIGNTKAKTRDPILVFDIDDTIYNFKDNLREKYLHCLDDFARNNNIRKEIYGDYYETYGHESLGFFINHRIPPAVYFNMIDKKVFKDFDPLVDNELINLLKSIDYKKYGFTNGYHKSIYGVLQKMQMLDLFEKILHPDYDNAEELIIKPHPESFSFVERYLNTEGENIYFFDDNKKNYKAALERGWNAYLVSPSTLKDFVKIAMRKIQKNAQKSS
ncbi:pyrimidine 5'-nucleotidase [Anncaliia algerae PRA109]|nr:pyrimidine 5'-nucleotidase [Anncaliia algerae PRA109]KCZ78148.1 pyrimidine 5'-nucleotidase [Anncaliia algerae PRA109]